MKKRDLLNLVDENLAYYNEDHWQFWIGPEMPESDPKHNEVMEAIAKVFQSSNRIKECIDRHRTALVGKRPHWYFVDASGDRVEDNTASAAEKLLQRWINRQYRLAISQENQLQDALAEAVKNMLVSGRGYLRLWSPKRFRNSADVIMRICLHSPHPNSVVINRDADGFTESIEYTYTEDDQQRKEVQAIDPDTDRTIFVTLDEKDQVIEEESTVLDLGGSYSIYEMRSPTLLNLDVKRAQNAINFALTMMPRNTEVGGFRERLILGAQPPGRWEEDKFIPDTQFRVGPGQMSFIQGVPLLDDMNNLKGYTNPSVFNSEPVSVQTFIDTAQAFVANIYHDMKQAHLLGSDLQLSGVSREQARQDFETALGDHAPIVEAAIAGAYGAALLMMLQSEVETYRDLDVMVQLRLSASKPLPEERAANREDYKAGLRSRTTAMAASGIDDPDGEQQLLLDEERSRNAVEDATSLLTTGVIDQTSALTMLKTSGRLKDDAISGNKDEVLNGNGAGG